MSIILIFPQYSGKLVICILGFPRHIRILIRTDLVNHRTSLSLQTAWLQITLRQERLTLRRLKSKVQCRAVEYELSSW